MVSTERGRALGQHCKKGREVSQHGKGRREVDQHANKGELFRSLTISEIVRLKEKEYSYSNNSKTQMKKHHTARGHLIKQKLRMKKNKKKVQECENLKEQKRMEKYTGEISK